MIHFAHANGFPGECYQQLYKSLRLTDTVSFIPMIGHNTDYPITDNWSYLIDEIIDSVVTQSNEAVVGVGHSLGGVLTLLASFKRPALFKQVILLDEPLFGFTKSTAIRLIKSLRLIHLVTPSKRSKKRKAIWPSKAEAKAYLLSKPLYQSFHSKCMDDYLDFALIERADKQFQLRFCREKESLIFETVPHTMHRLAKKTFIPVSLIYSESSHIITKHDLRKMKKGYGFSTMVCQGSHLFPLEYPGETAQHIQQLIHQSSRRVSC